MPDVAVLADRARFGDPAALSLLLEQTEPDLRKFAARLCPSESAADDAVQHAMLTVTLNLGSFRGLARFSTWIFAVIQNECRKHVRMARRFVFAEEDVIPADSELPDEALERQRMLEIVVNSIRALRPELREVFVLRELEGLSTEAASRALGISENNLKVRLNRARAALRQSILSVSPEMARARARRDSL
jgi:RNA polymerase sigma factor (sigma-70 family)